MKIVNIIRNYLPHDKCDELNNWVLKAIDNNELSFGITISPIEKRRISTPNRFTSRLGEKTYEYPQLVRDLHKQIQTEFNLTKWAEPKHSHGKDGVVVSATKHGGNVYAHSDPVDNQEPKHTLRCNILSSETEGGLIWVGKQSYTLKKGDMMQYLVSKHQHGVENVIAKEGVYRIMWMFGWYVDGDEWEASIQ